MKLTTRYGELELPQDFNLTMERTNPLLSDQGDVTIPASLPASSRNLAVIGHKDRIDRANVYENKMEAILQVGPVQKRGQLVIDTVQRYGGIDASFAIDSSDLYVKSKDKSLKKIFEDKTEDFNNMAVAVSHMYGIYSTGNMSWPYNVFPVAVSPYKVGDSVTYQINNEPGNNTLISGVRTVHDGDTEVSVPAGYGIAPFYRLCEMLNDLFGLLGYTVVENCFAGNPYNRIVLLHNCADCLCHVLPNGKVRLHYADMVPSCTLSEFLNWLLAKFHVQPVVNSEEKTVKVYCMEDMIGEEASTDLTGKIDGRWKLTLQPKKRIILTPSVGVSEEDEELDQESVESLTRPAARTLKEFVEKYGEYVDVNEDQWNTLQTDTPYCSGCAVLRKALGIFYALEINAATGLQTGKRLGTNHFVYDRDNSEESESFNQDDVIPAMLTGILSKKDIIPYIGERIHYHTAIDNEKEKSEQKIMVAQFRFNNNFGAKTTGTTQDFIPYDGSTGGVNLAWPLTNEGIYNTYWKLYNQLLLNQSPHITATVKTNIARLLGADMALPMMCEGQMLIPVRASGRISEKPVMAECEFILSKKFADGITDDTYPPAQTNGLAWHIESNYEKLGETLFEEDKSDLQTYWESQHATMFTPDATLTYMRQTIDMQNPTISVGPPTYEGEVRIVNAPATVTVHYDVFITFEGSTDTLHFEEDVTYDNQEVTYILTAVAV